MALAVDDHFNTMLEQYVEEQSREVPVPGAAASFSELSCPTMQLHGHPPWKQGWIGASVVGGDVYS